MQDKLESEVAEDARTSLKAQLMRKNPRCGMLINTFSQIFSDRTNTVQLEKKSKNYLHHHRK
jgi:hypothetical protein